jgi:uncharacterized protein YcbK (DUF882 family)
MRYGSADMGNSRQFRAGFVTLAALGTSLALAVSPGTASADVTHVVGKGHTIDAIAARYHVTAKAITQANPNVNPKRLRIGETLTIPGVAPKGGDKSTPAAKAEGQAKAAPAGKAPGANAAGAPSTPAANAANPNGRAGVGATASANAKPEKTTGKDAYAGKSKHPGVVHLVRFGTGEEATVNVSARGKVPGAALEQFKKMMHSTSGQTHSPDPRLVALLGIVSNHFGGKKIEIISGFRPFSPKQYTPHSNHNHGRAMDFRVQGVPNTVLRDFCRTLHDVGVGYYPNSVFVHLDVRSAPAFWIDYSKPGEPPRYHAPNVDADEGASDVHAEHPTLNGPPPGSSAETPSAPGAAPGADKPAEPSAPSSPSTPAAPATPAASPATPAAPKVELPKPSAGAPSP